MFAELLNQPEDPKIVARRARDEARRKRILDPSQYANGADRSALQAQIAEKEAAAAAAAEAARAEAHTLKEIDRQTMLLAQQQAEARAAAIRETVDFRMMNQRKEMTDSFALNNPNELKQTLVDESQFGKSSLQVFDGEDRGYADRKRAQVEQMRQWTVEAGEHAMETRRAELDERATHEDVLAKQQQVTLSLDHQTQQLARSTREIYAKSNLEIAAEQRRMRREQQQQEQEDALRHMVAQVHALEEDPAKAVGPNGKILTDRFKGFTPAQLEEIRAEQQRQVEAIATARALSAAEEAEAAAQARAQARQVFLLERQMKRAAMEQVRTQTEENKRLAAEKAARDTVLKNEIDDSFFSQFQTSCR